MAYSITVADQYHYHGQVVFGLAIEAPNKEFPLLVGCSLRTPQGGIIDLPAGWLSSPGLALWDVKVTADFMNKADRYDGWHGEIKFALWRNATFSERLADTVWLPWGAPYLIGASTAGLDMQDAEIKNKYRGRLRVWKEA
jgi:hypothetical protein